MRRLLAFFLLLFIACGISGAYGILHDQVSLIISEEYYTRFKFDQFGLTTAPLLSKPMKAGIVGFQATWWMGLWIGAIVGGFGFIHGSASTMIRNTLIAYALVLPTTIVVGSIGLLYGWFLADHDPANYPHWYIPQDLQFPIHYLSVGYLHNAGYLGGGFGIMVGVGVQVWLRVRTPRRQVSTTTKSPAP